jgi:hypothetical protein
MTDTTLVIETEDGERFVADILDFEFEVDVQQYGGGVASKEFEEHRYEVGALINAETGEEH